MEWHLTYNQLLHIISFNISISLKLYTYINHVSWIKTQARLSNSGYAYIKRRFNNISVKIFHKDQHIIALNLDEMISRRPFAVKCVRVFTTRRTRRMLYSSEQLIRFIIYFTIYNLILHQLHFSNIDHFSIYAVKFVFLLFKLCIE